MADDGDIGCRVFLQNLCEFAQGSLCLVAQRMKLHTFLIYTTLGAGLWNTILAAIGYYLSTVPGIESEEQLLAKVTEYSHELGYCFIVIGVFIVGFLVYKGMKKKK